MNRPLNVLFITCDQLRWDTLGFQNRFPVTTPTIDRLAREGVVFDNAYCSYPLCVPSRASITTGRPCYEHGVYYNQMGWPDEVPTLPGTLQRNGYHSVSVGKMHFQPRNLHHGFAKRRADNDIHYQDYLERLGISRSADDVGPGDGTPHFPDRIAVEYKTADPGVPAQHYVTNYITDQALQELDLIRRRRDLPPDGDEPFFMWLSYVKPHTPCDPPEPYRSMYDADDLPGINRDPGELERFPKQLQWYKSHWDVLEDQVIRELRARYLANVTLIDDQLKRVMDKLEELDMIETTLIIFSSDHGDYLGDHHCQQKSFFHDCSSRVPLIFWGAGVHGGRWIRENCSHIDLMPTVLEANSLARPGRRDPFGELLPPYSDFSPAVSLWPAVTGAGKLDTNRVVFCESGVHGYSLMLKQGQFKYNYYEDSHEIERMDLETDPDELHGELFDVNNAGLPVDVAEVLRYIRRRAHEHSGRYYGMGDWQMIFT